MKSLIVSFIVFFLLGCEHRMPSNVQHEDVGVRIHFQINNRYEGWTAFAFTSRPLAPGVRPTLTGSVHTDPEEYDAQSYHLENRATSRNGPFTADWTAHVAVTARTQAIVVEIRQVTNMNSFMHCRLPIPHPATGAMFEPVTVPQAEGMLTCRLE